VTPRVIFFDMGQTLIAGGSLSPRRLVGSRLALSERETKKVGRLIMTHPATEPSSLAYALRGILLDREPRGVQTVLEEVWTEQTRGVQELDDATMVLRILKEKGFTLGLLSNTWHPLYLGFCSKCPEMAELFDHFILSFRLGCKKPSLEIYRRALAQTGGNPDQCWMVGDSYELDMEPALAMGMHGIWVLHHPEREKTLLSQVINGQKSRPDWSVNHLAEILDYFARKGLP
jgi:HAD superfamily hydrolase (TIGR01509 family)